MSLGDGRQSLGTAQRGGEGGGSSTGRRFRANAPPKDATTLAIAALTVSGLVVLGTWGTLHSVRTALVTLKRDDVFADAILVLLALAAIVLTLPAIRSFRLAGQVSHATSGGDLICARTAAASSRNLAWITFGFACALVVVLLVIQFLILNKLSVGRTFFLLPLIGSTFFLILKAFWVNVYIALISEALVLVWGLILAVARLAPGEAGKPIRMLAIFYIDVFRGIPAIINIFLVGYGLPLTGLAIFKNLSESSLAILALTLTSSAYAAEVYRTGIETIHWSQTAAARSLGLSHMQTLRFVIVPQGVRRITPLLLNRFIGLQKDTALVNVIGTIDAFNQSMIIASNHFNLSSVTTVAVLFVIITIPQARFVDYLVERDQRRMSAGGN